MFKKNGLDNSADDTVFDHDCGEARHNTRDLALLLHSNDIRIFHSVPQHNHLMLQRRLENLSRHDQEIYINHERDPHDSIRDCADHHLRHPR